MLKTKTILHENIFIFLMLAVFLYSGWRLFLQDYPLLEGNTLTPLATISEINNTVKKKSGNRFAWNDAKLSQTLHSGDQVYTHETSKVSLNFSDGSSITLLENTLIKIQAQLKETSIVLKEGILYIKGGKKGKIRVKVKDSDLTIMSEMAKIQVTKNTESTDFLVLDGEASINFNNEIIKVNKNEFLKISDKTKPEIRKTGYSLKAPKNGVRLPLNQEVKFDWSTTETNLPLRFILSKDQSFESFELNLNTSEKQFSHSFTEPGLYYWKVINTKVNHPEEIRSLFIFNPIKVMSPLGNSVVQMLKPDSPILFRWENPKNDRFLIQVSDEKEFRNILFSTYSNTDNTSWNKSNLGEYFWRIRRVNTKKTDFSPAYFFKINRPPPPRPPKIKHVPKKFKIRMKKTKKDFSFWNILIPPAYADVSKEAVLSWPEIRDIKKYIIEIYEDPKMERLITRGEVLNNSFVWTNPPSTKFFWRIAAIDFWDQRSEFSALISGELIFEESKKKTRKIVKRHSQEEHPRDYQLEKKKRRIEYFKTISSFSRNSIQLVQISNQEKFSSTKDRINIEASGLSFSNIAFNFKRNLRRSSFVEASVQRTSAVVFNDLDYNKSSINAGYGKYFFIGQDFPLFYTAGLAIEERDSFKKIGIDQLEGLREKFIFGTLSLGGYYLRRSKSEFETRFKLSAGQLFAGEFTTDFHWKLLKSYSFLTGIKSDYYIYKTEDETDVNVLNFGLRLGIQGNF